MKQILKKVSIIGTILVMIVSLAGCKDKESGKNDKNSKNNQPSAEYGYNTEYEDIENLPNMSNSVMRGNTVYFTSHVYNEALDKNILSLQSLDFSSPKDIKTYVSYENSLPGDRKPPYTYILSIYPHDNGITYFKMTVTYEGNADSKAFASLELTDIPEDAVITEEDIQQLGMDLEAVGLEFRDISSMTAAQTVKLYNELLSDNKLDGGEISESISAMMITVDFEGKETASKDITEQLNSDSGFIMSACDNDETLYLYSQKTQNANNAELENFITIFHLASLEAETISLGDIEVYGMTATQAGEIVSVIMDKNGSFAAAKWDKKKKRFAKEKDSSLSANWINKIYPAGKNSFYYVDEGFLYQYDFEKNKTEKLLKFLDYNILSNQIVSINYTDENHINVITNESGFQEEYLGLNRLTRVKASEMAKKTEITLACKNADWAVQSAVIRFNKTNPDYKILIDDTIDYDNEMTQFHNAILSGDGPDLIDLSSFDYSRYEGSGLFADIYEYIKKDENFSKKRLNENVLRLFEQDGKLFALPITYTITTLASAKSTLGDAPLTIDKFSELMEDNPDKDMLSRFTNREDILKRLLLYNQNYFIDYEKKTCNFTDGNFEKLLNVAKLFPTEQELNDTMSEDDYLDFEEKRVYEGRQLFYELNINDLNKYQIAEYIFGDDINITGYPSVEGGQPRAYISSGFSNLFAINAGSKYKEECWSFIKILYEQTGAQEYYGGFPIDLDMLDELLEEYSTPKMMTDENGNQIEEPNTYNYNNELEINVYALSKEQTDIIRELASSVSVLAPKDEAGDIIYIVSEEAEPFFIGEKSAADVCSVIQSRINIKINENS